MDEYCKRSGQIPAFGNCDFANELPISQYFKSSREAGLISYSSSSGETDPYMRGEHDLNAVDYKKPIAKVATRIKDRRYTNAMVNDKETRVRKQWKVYDVKEHPRKQTMNNKKVVQANDVVRSGHHQLPSKQHPKPVDEDLYKIPPELLRTTKRKKMLGFISKCLVPDACVS